MDELPGAYVEGDINALIDIFAEYYVENDDGSEDTTDNYYIVPIGEEEYFALKVNEADFDIATQIYDETYEYFLKRDGDTSLTIEVKIIEVLTDNLDIIRTVLDKLKDGADFRELAVKYTTREEAKKNNGELGFFNSKEYGEIGSKASLMNVGEMYGPIKVQEGYSLFKLIEKKETKNFTKQNFEQRKDLLKVELKSKKYSDAIIKKTLQLANKYNFQINEEILRSIKVFNTTTVVYRNFGFGGKLLAVPLTPPNYIWFKFWQEQENLAP
jgi:predicted nucleic acid-binding protein